MLMIAKIPASMLHVALSLQYRQFFVFRIQENRNYKKVSSEVVRAASILFGWIVEIQKIECMVDREVEL